MDYKAIYNQDYFSGKTSFFYKLGYGKYASFYFDNMFRQISGYVKKIKNGSVLDVGCAYGLMLQRFPDDFKKFGVDVSEYAIGVAKRSLPSATFEVGNVEEELPFTKGIFDVVMLNDVLEHLENPQRALKNIQRVLKKHGVLYITTPNLNTIRKNIFNFADNKEHHISLFSHPELIMLLDDAGFNIVEHWTFLNSFVYLKFGCGIGPESAVICKKQIS